MTPETFINAKLTLQERAMPVNVNSEFIYKLMEEYAEIQVKETTSKIELELWKLPSEITGV